MKEVEIPGEKITVSDKYIPVGIIYPETENGCCVGKPFAITINRTVEKRLNYSCQCVCGLWCTNGHDNPGDAVNEYQEMCRIHWKEGQDG